MFESLSQSLSSVFNRLGGTAIITEEVIDTAMKGIKNSLLDADVNVEVVESLIAEIKEKATGQKVVKSVQPAHMVTKIVQDHIIEVLGSERSELVISDKKPSFIMMMGLQGAGKTTTSAKLAYKLEHGCDKKTLLLSVDIYRPAAIEQLRVLAKDNGIYFMEVDYNQKIEKIVKQTQEYATKNDFDVVIIDTAGRLQIDQQLMEELANIDKTVPLTEKLLVADAMMGQESVSIATAFQEKVGVSGLVMTRVDGDARGGAILSMKKVAGCGIKYLSEGEDIKTLSEFYPDRIASRILGQGDIVSLVEEAQANLEQKEADKLSKKIQQGKFDFDDLTAQISLMNKLGGFKSVLKFIPGMGDVNRNMQNFDESAIVRNKAIIDSMTKDERSLNVEIDRSRIKRIAKGCGLDEQHVVALLKMRQQMVQMMSKIKGVDSDSLSRGGLENMLRGGMKKKRVKVNNKSKKLNSLLGRLPR